MGRLAEERPGQPGVLSGVMMDHHFAEIEARFARDGTHAQPADLADAALLDDAAQDCEDLAQRFPCRAGDVGQSGDDVAGLGQVVGKTAQNLFGAQVEVEVPSFVQLGRHLVEAVLLGRDNGGFGGRGPGWRGRFLLLFTAGEQGQRRCGGGGYDTRRGHHGYSLVVPFA